MKGGWLLVTGHWFGHLKLNIFAMTKQTLNLGNQPATKTSNKNHGSSKNYLGRR